MDKQYLLALKKKTTYIMIVCAWVMSLLMTYLTYGAVGYGGFDTVLEYRIEDFAVGCLVTLPIALLSCFVASRLKVASFRVKFIATLFISAALTIFMFFPLAFMTLF